MNLKSRAPASTHKKVVVLLLDGTSLPGYLNPAGVATAETIDLLTPEGEHQAVKITDVKMAYFVADLNQPFEPARTSFLSRPKIEGLWVKMTFQDGDTLEGIAANELLEVLDRGIQITPPDLHGNCLRIFVPRTSVTEVKVLGVVGTAKRAVRAASTPLPEQPRLFNE